MTSYGPFEKFKRWLAEINYNAIQDRITRTGGTASDHATKANLKRYLEHKSPFGG